jgi:hypothetical protein
MKILEFLWDVFIDIIVPTVIVVGLAACLYLIWELI